MAAGKGRLMLLKIGDGGGPEAFTTIGGLKSTGMTVNNTSFGPLKDELHHLAIEEDFCWCFIS